MQGGQRGNAGDQDDLYGSVRYEDVGGQVGSFRSDGGRAGSVFGMAAASVSGGVVGFFVAGDFGLGSVAFAAVAVGCFLGWMARGFSK